MQSSDRKQRFANIRMSLKQIPVIGAKSRGLTEKIEKKSRRASIHYGDHITIDLDNFPSDDQDTSPSLFHEKYILGEKAGQGAHGVVRRCVQNKTGDVLAVKTQTLQREQILILKKNFTDIKALSHPNILSYKSLYFEMKNARCYLVMEYFPHPELIDIPPKSQQELKQIAFQLFQTISYLHKNKICHRDIKPENILYDKICRHIKLIDFGISKKVEERGRKRQMLTLTGTPYYRAPEMFEGGGYDEMVDIWAAGITLFKLITGYTPFESEYHSQTISKIRKDEVVFPEQLKFPCSVTLKRFIKDLLSKNKKERPTADQALKNMFFLDYGPRDQITKSMNICPTEMNNSLTKQQELSTSDGTKKKSKIDDEAMRKTFDAIEQTQEIFGYEECLN